MVPSNVLDYIRRNADWSSFCASLLKQFESRGSLTSRQIESIEAQIAKAAAPRAPAPAPTYTLKPGEMIEVKPWIAHRLQADAGLEFFFRNLEIVEVQGESPKAYKVTVKFVTKIVCNCHICGRDLDNEISKATGIGPVCADKMGLPRPTLATAKDTLALIEAKCAAIGVVGPVWIPKSQIKGRITEAAAPAPAPVIEHTRVAPVVERPVSFTEALRKI